MPGSAAGDFGPSLPSGDVKRRCGAVAMKEVVLDVGPQTSLWGIVQIADEQLRSIHGSPKNMIVRSKGIEIEAMRPRFEGEFDAFTVRFPQVGGKLVEAVRSFAADCRVPCKVTKITAHLS